MPRGEGKHAKEAIKSGKLSAFIKATNGNDQLQAGMEYVDWAEINPDYIIGALWAVNKEGGSLLFGHTRDKKSYSIMVFYGGDKTPYYFPCTGDGVAALETFLLGLREITD